MRCIFPTIVLSCYLNPSLDFYFSCFYALSSQTDGKLSEDRDYVLRFLWIPDAPKQSRKEQVLGQNRLLWFRLQRPDLVHTGCQERREKKNKRAGFIRYPTENLEREHSHCPESLTAAWAASLTSITHWVTKVLIIPFFQEDNKNQGCLFVLSSKIEAFLSHNW